MTLRVIETRKELESLPELSVVMDEDANAYQRDDEQSWSHFGRLWETQQIDLPVTVLYRGGDPIPV